MTTEPAPFADRVAVVTGGTRGIGRAVAEALAAWGATVVVTGRDREVAEQSAKQIGPSAVGHALDVTDFDGVGALFRQIAADYGRLDGVVANAGAMEEGLLGMIRAEQVRRLLDVNVAGTIATVQAAGRAMMRRKSGSIVVLASIVGERGSPGQTVYAAAKAAVASVARSAAKELGPRGIRVNAVAPGLIQTDLIASLPPEVLERQTAQTSLRRLGTPADVAGAVRFLLSDEASFITGQVLGIDGGMIV